MPIGAKRIAKARKACKIASTVNSRSVKPSVQSSKYFQNDELTIDAQESEKHVLQASARENIQMFESAIH